MSKPIDGKPCDPSNGGKTCEDPPGVREGGGVKLYIAYLRDPDGNKLWASHRVG